MTEPQPGEWWCWTNDPEHPFVIRDVDAVDVTVAARRVVSA